MARRVFFSFHFKPDNWRASQVRNIGAIDGNSPVTDNEWEQITKRGDAAIERWIDDQLVGKSCTVLLIGENTAGRKWIRYEIRRSWELGKGIVGVYVHALKDSHGVQAHKGSNPFKDFNIDRVAFDRIVRSYDPPFSTSNHVYQHISDNLAGWVDEAVAIRSQYPGARSAAW